MAVELEVIELEYPEEVPEGFKDTTVRVYVTEAFSTDGPEFMVLMRRPLEFLNDVGIDYVDNTWTIVTELPKHQMFTGYHGGAKLATHLNSKTVTITVFKIDDQPRA